MDPVRRILCIALGVIACVAFSLLLKTIEFFQAKSSRLPAIPRELPQKERRFIAACAVTGVACLILIGVVSLV